MTEQRLPLVDGDDGAWGEILNQYISKEHYQNPTLAADDVDNGGHETITIRPGTTAAATAPLKFTSGDLMTAAEAGAVEFLTDKLYLTQTTSTIRNTIAAYNDASGAAGDIYYRDASANFFRLPIGNVGDVLIVDTGLPALPAWTDLSATYQINSEKGDPLGYASLDSGGVVVEPGKYHNHQAGIEGEPTITEGTSGNAGKVSVATGEVWFYDDSGRDTMTLHTMTGGSWLSPVDEEVGYVCADKVADDWAIVHSIDDVDYLRYVPYFKVIKRTGSNSLHHQNIGIESHSETENHHLRTVRTSVVEREPDALGSISVDVSLNITASGGGVWAANHRYYLPGITPATRQFQCSQITGTWTITSNTTPVLNNTQWNNVSTGLATLTATYWNITYLYRGVEDQDHCYTVLGTSQYATSVLAQSDNTIPTVPVLVSGHTIFVGRIIAQKSATTGFIYESAFKTVFAAATAVSDHGSLSGLADDDHAQYHNDARGDARYPIKDGVAKITVGVTDPEVANPGSSVAGDLWIDTN